MADVAQYKLTNVNRQESGGVIDEKYEEAIDEICGS
jgi:hypothetical protein